MPRFRTSRKVTLMPAVNQWKTPMLLSSLVPCAVMAIMLPVWLNGSAQKNANPVRPAAQNIDYDPWTFFVDFSTRFNKGADAQHPLKGWTSNCEIWPVPGYCNLTGVASPSGPDQSDQSGTQASTGQSNIDTASASLSAPRLASSILYDDNAHELFKGCIYTTQADPANPCQNISRIAKPISTARAMWAEVSSTLPAVIYDTRDIASCQKVDRWTYNCPAVRRRVNLDETLACNMSGYPWKGDNESINLNCFPHLKVTKENANFFQFEAGEAFADDYMILLAFHILQASPSENGAQWKEMTFWWQGKPPDPNTGTLCPSTDLCSKLLQPWPLFAMKTSILPSAAGSTIPPAANPYIETPLHETDEAKTNCQTCHAFAGYMDWTSAQLGGAGGSVGITVPTLNQRASAYFKNCATVPTAGLWTLAIGLENGAPKPPDTTCRHSIPGLSPGQ
jgi:hypothetical protein